MHRNNGIAGTHQACAACKHQRKKCTDKCILGPYFPAEKVREFQAVHKVFGVSNVQKMVKTLINDEDRKRAVESLVWEALCRQRDPILGPYGEYRKLYDELKLYQNKTHNHNPNQVQAQTQIVTQNGHSNGLIYKQRQGLTGLIGWASVNGNGSSAMSNNNNQVNCAGNGGIHDGVTLVDCIRANCGPGMDSGIYYGAPNNMHGAEKMRQERDHVGVGSVVAPQQHLINGFNQHYYLPGQLSPMDDKSMESSIWEAGS